MLTITIGFTTLRVFAAAANLAACPGTSACHDRSNSGVTAALAQRCSPAQATERELAACLALRGGGSIWSWFEDVLRSIGLFSKEGKLLVIGLDNAGKSTLLTVLMRDEVVPHAPTHQPVSDVIKVGKMRLRAVDMGGHEIARRMWVQYSHEADGIVYIVDAVDRDRFTEAALELHKLLAASSLPPKTPVLILGNKVDLPGAAREEEMYYGLGLDELYRAGDGSRPLRLFMCSVFERRGYLEGFQWLGDQL